MTVRDIFGDDYMKGVMAMARQYFETMPKPPSAIETTHAEEARLFDSVVLSLIQMGKTPEEAVAGAQYAVKERRTIHL